MAITKALFQLIMVTASALFSMALGASYTVGAPAGSWDLKTNYTQWTSTRRFFPGDSLRFQYPTATHNILEVTKTAYYTCNTSVSNAVIATYQTGNDVITFAASGVTRYFVCGFPGHCAVGMKLRVNVGAQSPAPVQCRGRGRGAKRIRCTRPAPASPAASSAIGGGADRSSLWLAAVVAAGSLLLCF
ncbi:basic blue protein [Brachypodium distachyon]|uniref:Phytocyanin domain-containing protein n=1 Tax=Brachypodium distachyon TaxID=15368 RepID=I1I0U1_BRADI|nr:basic blue protein [Brachypodium distachyon]KQJ95016.1 hypothetical protein BRADI_3g14680v3 [Brachypodium distachyon]|eukprot:XP_003571371.1 basic blue protein [Brachypodium distachyon]